MKLIKIGSRLINLDRVTTVELDAETLNWDSRGTTDGSSVPAVAIHFGGRGDDRIDLVGAEREAFLDWVRDGSRAIDLLPAGPEDRDFADYLLRGGTLDRTDWDLRRHLLQSERSRPNPDLDRCGDLESELLL